MNLEQSNLETIRTDKKVDWENTVQLGQGPGKSSKGYLDQYSQQQYTGQQVVGQSSHKIPPNQRAVVQQFFSEQREEQNE